MTEYLDTQALPFTLTAREQLLEALRKCMPVRDAALQAGLEPTAVEEARKSNRFFNLEVRRAQAEGKLAQVTKVADAPDWRSAQVLLDRVWPKKSISRKSTRPRGTKKPAIILVRTVRSTVVPNTACLPDSTDDSTATTATDESQSIDAPLQTLALATRTCATGACAPDACAIDASAADALATDASSHSTESESSIA
jgi:hypothetical protein